MPNLSSNYQMILGRDLISELGLVLDFNDHGIIYRHLTLPMESSKGEKAINFTTNIKEPQATQEAVDRIKDILDAKYALVSCQQILDNSPHLTDNQKATLKPVLEKHKELFDGTFGKWKGFQHKLELKDPSLPPVACKPYPVPVSRKQTLMLEIERLYEVGMLRKVNRSE